jgi:hypothetical protein
MIRSKLWFRCAAGRDPVSPVVVRPAVIGWDAQERTVDLTIQRSFEGEELLRRMKGWVTADVDKVLQVIRKHGDTEVANGRELVVAMPDDEAEKELKREFRETFGDQVHLERLAAEMA